MQLYNTFDISYISSRFLYNGKNLVVNLVQIFWLSNAYFF